MDVLSIYYVFCKSSVVNVRHFVIKTFMASSTRISGGKIPVDSTETERDVECELSNETYTILIQEIIVKIYDINRCVM